MNLQDEEVHIVIRTHSSVNVFIRLKGLYSRGQKVDMQKCQACLLSHAQLKFALDEARRNLCASRILFHEYINPVHTLGYVKDRRRKEAMKNITYFLNYIRDKTSKV